MRSSSISFVSHIRWTSLLQAHSCCLWYLSITVYHHRNLPSALPRLLEATWPPLWPLMSHRNIKNPSKKLNPPHTLLCSPQIPKAQPNRHLYHPQNTLPHLQKAPWLKRTQNNENKTNFRIFSVSAISPHLDNRIGPNFHWNRTRSVATHTQKVPQVKWNENNRKMSQKHCHITPCTLAMDPTVFTLLKDMKKHILECWAEKIAQGSCLPHLKLTFVIHRGASAAGT